MKLRLAILLTLNLSGLVLSAQTNEGAQILFLHLKVKGQTISLLDATAVPGVLKPQRKVDEGIEYEVVSSKDEPLWTGAIHDPRERRVEDYKNPGSGELQVKIIRSEEAEFTVRVPLISAAARIDFYALEPSAPGGTNAQPSTVRKKLGSVLMQPK